MRQKTGDWQFVVIWEFLIKPGAEKRFEKAYGPDGIWAQFFRQDERYIRTELIRDLKRERTYLTLDLWTSPEAYEAFRLRHAGEYKEIDVKFEEITESEHEIGRYGRIGV